MQVGGREGRKYRRRDADRDSGGDRRKRKKRPRRRKTDADRDSGSGDRRERRRGREYQQAGGGKRPGRSPHPLRVGKEALHARQVSPEVESNGFDVRG